MSSNPIAAIAAMIKRIIPAIATRGRILTMLGFGFLPVVLGFFINRAQRDDPAAEEFEAAELLAGFSLLIFVPLVVLVFAAATLGTLREERTLVYFWLRPIGRWQISVAALLSAWLVLIPLVVIPTGAFALVVGEGSDLSGILAAAIVGVISYGAIFTVLGLVTQRSLVWGLVYVLVWEGFVGGLSETAGRFSIRNYTRSLLARIADVPLLDNPQSVTTVVIVTVGIAVVSLSLSTLILNRMDID